MLYSTSQLLHKCKKSLDVPVRRGRVCLRRRVVLLVETGHRPSQSRAELLAHLDLGTDHHDTKITLFNK